MGADIVLDCCGMQSSLRSDGASESPVHLILLLCFYALSCLYVFMLTHTYFFPPSFHFCIIFSMLLIYFFAASYLFFLLHPNYFFLLLLSKLFFLLKFLISHLFYFSISYPCDIYRSINI